MRKITIIFCVSVIFLFSFISVNAFELLAEQHETGKIVLNINNGSPPYQIYRSLDNENFNFVTSVDTDIFIEYGLEGGKTYFYKVIDSNNYEAFSRYSVPILFEQIIPLTIINITDNQATIEWDMYDFKNCNIYLNGLIIESVNDITSYTLDNLSENTEYTVYLLNEFGIKSNTITFRTTDYFDQLDKLLKELFVKDLNVDSDSDGLPDIMESIGDKIDSIVDNLGGSTITGVKDVIESVDYDTGIEDLQNLPKVQTNFRGLNIKILDLDDSRYLEIMDTLRFIVLCVLTVTFIFLALSFLDVNFKVQEVDIIIFNSILSAIDNILGWVLNKIPNININLAEFIDRFTYLVDMTKSFNYILPIKEALAYVAILLGIRFAMLLFWASMRVINLLRGAG